MDVKCTLHAKPLGDSKMWSAHPGQQGRVCTKKTHPGQQGGEQEKIIKKEEEVKKYI
jgi:hypothetical protein